MCSASVYDAGVSKMRSCDDRNHVVFTFLFPPPPAIMRRSIKASICQIIFSLCFVWITKFVIIIHVWLWKAFAAKEAFNACNPINTLVVSNIKLKAIQLLSALQWEKNRCSKHKGREEHFIVTDKGVSFVKSKVVMQCKFLQTRVKSLVYLGPY